MSIPFLSDSLSLVEHFENILPSSPVSPVQNVPTVQIPSVSEYFVTHRSFVSSVPVSVPVSIPKPNGSVLQRTGGNRETRGGKIRSFQGGTKPLVRENRTFSFQSNARTTLLDGKKVIIPFVKFKPPLVDSNPINAVQTSKSTHEVTTVVTDTLSRPLLDGDPVPAVRQIHAGVCDSPEQQLVPRSDSTPILITDESPIEQKISGSLSYVLKSNLGLQNSELIPAIVKGSDAITRISNCPHESFLPTRKVHEIEHSETIKESLALLRAQTGTVDGGIFVLFLFIDEAMGEKFLNNLPFKRDLSSTASLRIQSFDSINRSRIATFKSMNEENSPFHSCSCMC